MIVSPVPVILTLTLTGAIPVDIRAVMLLPIDAPSAFFTFVEVVIILVALVVRVVAIITMIIVILSVIPILGNRLAERNNAPLIGNIRSSFLMKAVLYMFRHTGSS